MEGIKYDDGKERFDLVVVECELYRAQVYTWGAAKYTDDNWKKVGRARYEAALMRHINAYRRGELLDSDSGLPHLALAQVTADFLIWFDLQTHPATIARGQRQYEMELKKRLDAKNEKSAFGRALRGAEK